ncbi:hypothetical protein V8E55_002736 [Tylopilus felleus]
MMCLLAIYQFLRQSVQLCKSRRGWKPNQYIELLVHQGIIYFVINFLHAIITEGLFSINFSQTVALTLTPALEVLIFTLNPRFILSIRELYANPFQAQYIDTGFGIGSSLGSSTLTEIGTMSHFADVGPGERLDEIEEVPMGKLRRQRYVDRV